MGGYDFIQTWINQPISVDSVAHKIYFFYFISI